MTSFVVQVINKASGETMTQVSPSVLKSFILKGARSTTIPLDYILQHNRELEESDRKSGALKVMECW